MQSKRVIILAQVFISGMMACLMTGFFTFLHHGASPGLVSEWFHGFIIAWPVAFCLSTMVSPVAFKMAGRVMEGRASS